jgi:hypothetical protein
MIEIGLRPFARPICQAHCPAGLRLLDSPRQFPIRHRLPIRNAAEGCPNTLLKVGSYQRHRQVEHRQLPRKISRELPLCLRERRRIVDPFVKTMSKVFLRCETVLLEYGGETSASCH